MVQRNVDLVVKMRDEASRAGNLIGNSLSRLADVQKRLADGASVTSQELGSVVTEIGSLKKAYDQMQGSVQGAESVVERQNDTLAKTEASYASLTKQIRAATDVVNRMRQVSANMEGGATPEFLARQKAAEKALADLTRQQTKLNTTLTQQRAAFGESRSSLLAMSLAADEVGRSIAEVADTSQLAQEQIRATSREAYAAMAEQEKQAKASAIASEKQAAAQAKFNREYAAGIALKAKSAQQSASVFANADTDSDGIVLSDRNAEILKNHEANNRAAAALVARLLPLTAAQNRYNTEMDNAIRLNKAKVLSDTKLKEIQDALQKELDDTTAALKRQAGEGNGNKKITLFGLKPYELQNLGYQINDVITQLASGTSLSQTLAQQGGQILQLFPRVGATLLSAFTNPLFLTAAVTFGAIALGINRAANEADRLRQFGALKIVDVDAARFSNEALSDTVEALRDLGVTADVATKATQQLVKEGVQPERLQEFATTAANLAGYLSTDLPEASRLLEQGLLHGYNGVRQLDDSLNFLTASQRDQIKTLYDQGNSTEALSMTLGILSGKMDEAARKSRGPWASATLELSKGWDALLTRFSNTQYIQNATNWINLLAQAMQGLAGVLPEGAGAGGAPDYSNALGAYDKQIKATELYIAAVQKRITMLRAGKSVGGNLQLLEFQLAQSSAQLDKLYADRATVRYQAEQRSRSDSTAANQTALKATQDLQAETAKRLAMEGKITTQKQLQARLDQIYSDRFKEVTNENPNASLESRQASARAAVSSARGGLEEQLRTYQKSIADATRKGMVEALNGVSGAKLVDTASKYLGYNENNASQRTSLQDFFKQNGVNVDPKMTAWCAAFVNAVLSTNGLPQSLDAKGNPNLMARSFANYGTDARNDPQVGDIVVLRRGTGNTQGHVGFFQGFDAKGNLKVLGGNQDGGQAVSTQTFNKQDVLAVRRAATYADAAKAELDLSKKQEDFDTKLADQIARRQQDTAQLKEQTGLIGEQLLAKQREAEIEDALLKARQQAEDAKISPDDPGLQKRLETLRQVTGAYFDASHAKESFEAQRAAVEKPVEDLTALRDSLQQQITFYVQRGQSQQALALEPELARVNGRLDEAIAKAREFWATLSPDQMQAAGLTTDQLDLIIQKLDIAKTQAQQFGFILGISTTDIAQNFASTAANGLDGFAQSIAAGENAIKSFGRSFRQVAAQFMLQIARMIQQQIIFNLVSSALRGFAGGLGGAAPVAGSGSFTGTGLQNFSVAHDGGLVGTRSRSRSIAISPAAVASLPRFHSGRIPGLAPNERAAVLESDEEVLTRNNPRHIFNQGQSGGGREPSIDFKAVNVFDTADVLSQALADRAGQKVFINFVRQNSRALSEALGNG